MLSNLNKEKSYYLLLISTIIRMLWLTIMEPNGAVKAAAKNPDLRTFVGFAASTIPYVIYPSMVILAIIIIGLLVKKYWAFVAALLFGLIHLLLIMILVILHANTGFGPWVVIPSCTGMIVFSLLILKRQVKFRVHG